MVSREIPGGHDVVVVHNLDEGFQARPLGDGLRGRLLNNLAGVLGNSSDQGVAIRSLLSSLLETLHDHGLATSISALQEDDHLVWLQKLHHCGQQSRALQQQRQAAAAATNGNTKKD